MRMLAQKQHDRANNTTASLPHKPAHHVHGAVHGTSMYTQRPRMHGMHIHMTHMIHAYAQHLTS